MKFLLILFTAALYGQNCTVTTYSGTLCPNSGSPTVSDQFGDTLNWTGVGSVFSGPAFGSFTAGATFRTFIQNAGSAFSTIKSNFPLSGAPATTKYCTEFWPFWQSFFTNDNGGSTGAYSCPGLGPPSCIYNNVAYAEKVADSLFAPPPTGLGLSCTDINIDPGPWFAATAANGFPTAQQYSTYCSAYSTPQAPSGNCYTPPSGTPNWGVILKNWAATYTSVFSYILTNYPNLEIHLSPTPSFDIFTTCGILTAASRTEAAMESCMMPLYQTAIANVFGTTASPRAKGRMTTLHEPAGVWPLFCGACPALNNPLFVDTFVNNSRTAVRAVNSNVLVGVGGTFSDMNTSGNGGWTCPNSGTQNCANASGGGASGTCNYWCDFVTPALTTVDYVGMDIYPSSAPNANYSTLFATPSPSCTCSGSTCTGSGCATYTWMALKALASSLPLYGNESSAMRWNYQGAGTGNEPATYIGAGWIGYQATATNNFPGWVTAVPVYWAQYMGLKAWDYIDAPILTCQSSDPNNTHACPNCTQTVSPSVPDTYMNTCMAGFNGATQISPAGILYGNLSPSLSAGVTIHPGITIHRGIVVH